MAPQQADKAKKAKKSRQNHPIPEGRPNKGKKIRRSRHDEHCEEVAKEVWGHLPDKLRQQMSQYYKEDFTPKYAELLKLYYSSLSDKGMKK